MSIITAVEPSPPDPPRPPPLPYISSRDLRWVIAASFPDIAQWHLASRLLSRHGIIARMQSSADNPNTVDLLVFETELEWVRDLLGKGASAGQIPTRAFPVVTPSEIHPPNLSQPPPVPNPMADVAIPAAPLSSPALSPATNATYSAVIVVLWTLFIIIVALIIVCCLIP